MSCALVLGSAEFKPYSKEKKIGIVMPQNLPIKKDRIQII